MTNSTSTLNVSISEQISDLQARRATNAEALRLAVVNRDALIVEADIYRDLTKKAIKNWKDTCTEMELSKCHSIFCKIFIDKVTPDTLTTLKAIEAFCAIEAYSKSIEASQWRSELGTNETTKTISAAKYEAFKKLLAKAEDEIIEMMNLDNILYADLKELNKKRERAIQAAIQIENNKKAAIAAQQAQAEAARLEALKKAKSEEDGQGPAYEVVRDKWLRGETPTEAELKAGQDEHAEWKKTQPVTPIAAPQEAIVPVFIAPIEVTEPVQSSESLFDRVVVGFEFAAKATCELMDTVNQIDEDEYFADPLIMARSVGNKFRNRGQAIKNFSPEDKANICKDLIVSNLRASFFGRSEFNGEMYYRADTLEAALKNVTFDQLKKKAEDKRGSRTSKIFEGLQLIEKKLPACPKSPKLPRPPVKIRNYR